MAESPEIWKAVAMADHFDKMQKLKDPVNEVPNFRRVPGYKVSNLKSEIRRSVLGLLASEK